MSARAHQLIELLSAIKDADLDSLALWDRETLHYMLMHWADRAAKPKGMTHEDWQHLKANPPKGGKY